LPIGLSSLRLFASTRKGDGGLAQLHRGEGAWDDLVGQVSPVRVSRSFATAPMSPAWSFRDRLDCFTERDADVARRSEVFFRDVVQVGIVLMTPERTLKKVMRPANGSAVVLENVGGGRLGIRNTCGDIGAVEVSA